MFTNCLTILFCLKMLSFFVVDKCYLDEFLIVDAKLRLRTQKLFSKLLQHFEF